MWQDIIDSKADSAILGFFLNMPERTFSVLEISKHLRQRPAKVIGSLSKLAEADLIKSFSKKGKRYYFLNEPLTPIEYRSRISYLKENPEALQLFLQKYNKLKQDSIFCANKNIQSENVVGDRLFRCQKCEDSFDLEKCDEVNRATFGFDGVSSQDVDFFGPMQLCYEGFSIFGQYNCVSTILCHYSHDAFYSEYCISSHHLFGCISLHHKEYAIFNKQYTKEEYLKLKAKIVDHMKKTGEWGEFFPVTSSPFPYNITVAQRYYPLSKEQIETKGWHYETAAEGEEEEYEGAFEVLPADTTSMDSSVVGKVFKCEKTGRPYQMIRQEYDYLHSRSMPLPRVHPDIRNERRMERRNPQALFQSSCGRCGKATQGSFDPAKKQNIYCPGCYQRCVINQPQASDQPVSIA